MKATIMILAALAFAVGFAQNYKCDWSVNGIGGGEMTGAYKCGSTVGQTAAGQLTGTSYWALIGFWQPEGQVGVREQAYSPNQGSLVTRLYTPQPNPFRTHLAIRYSLATSEPAVLQVYDRVGRLVRAWAVSCRPSAVSSVTWDGRDQVGRNLANGVYICRLVAGDYRATEKLVLQR